VVKQRRLVYNDVMARPKPNLTTEQLKERSAAWVKKWRDNNPEKQALARKRAYNNRKLKAILRVGEAKCNRCGCDEIDFLEFNHKNGGGCKEWRETKGRPNMDRILTANRGVEDLEILCRICNAWDYLLRKNEKQAKRFDVLWD
jgi:hypothetical protein